MKRITIKAITYRVVSYLATAIVIYLVTRKLHLAATLGLADSAGKFCLYLIHETIWSKIP